MECKKQIKRLFSVTLPSAMAITLGKVTTWEHALPSAKAIALGKVTDLPSVTGQALGKGLMFTECLDGTLGK